MALPYIVVDPWNQYGGSMRELRRMTLAAFEAGADAIKPQLFSSKERFGDYSRRHLEFHFEELEEYYCWASQLGIDVFCSAFDVERVGWCISKGLGSIKIPSEVSHKHPEVVEDVLGAKYGNDSPVFTNILISTGHHKHYEFPWKDERIRYLYCVPSYPAWLYDERVRAMPKRFGLDGYAGYSDHCPGIAAALEAVRRGATIIEKHFTMDVNAQSGTEKAHACSFTPESLRQFVNIAREWEVMG